MENQLVPRLRFPDFKDELNKVMLKKVAIINPKSEELPESFIYIDLESVKNGFLSKEERINKFDAPSRAQRLLKKGDILYQTVRPYQKNNFFFNKNETDFVSSTGYAQIRTKQIPEYLYQYLHTENFVNKVLVRCTGTSYPAINSTDLSKINIYLPNIPEQQKIASFLTDVDEVITKLTKKKNLLEQYKKGIMQKIFNQELRFKDDNGNEFPKWKENKLGDICELHHGYQFRSTDFTKEGLAVIKISNVIGSQLNLDDITFIDEKRYDEFKRFEILDGDILMSLTGNIGRVIEVNRKPFTLIQNYRVGKFEPFDKNVLIKPFLKYLLVSDLVFGRFNQLSNQSAQANFGKQDMNKITVQFPTTLEQSKIANFLSDIDIKIEALNTKIENTKAFKKGLLQQMFV